MDAELFDAFRSVGVADVKAMAAAQALGKREPDILTMKGDIETLKSDVASMKVDIATLKIDLTTLKVDGALLKWMLGFVFAGVLALVLKAFVH